MSVTYDSIAFELIEEGLKNHINNEFQSVYISPVFVDRGNEFIRINLLSSHAIDNAYGYEVREYKVMIKYYNRGNMAKLKNNEAIKRKSDRLKKHLQDKQDVILNSHDWCV